MCLEAPFVFSHSQAGCLQGWSPAAWLLVGVVARDQGPYRSGHLREWHRSQTAYSQEQSLTGAAACKGDAYGPNAHKQATCGQQRCLPVGRGDEDRSLLGSRRGYSFFLVKELFYPSKFEKS
ncbi:hypothetical protein GW17_00062113 [Ensete ventricosum]|nr:hypothetical protein GW17_00062113 [Ensete ventricosum]